MELSAFVSTKQAVPTWYGLRSINETTAAIHVHPDTVDGMTEDALEQVPRVLHDVELPSFIGLEQKHGGFGGMLCRGEFQGWPEWSWSIEPLPAEGDNATRWQQLLCITGSLKTMFVALFGASAPTSGNTSQLMVVRNPVVGLRNGASISVMVCEPLASWLRPQANMTLQPVIEAMYRLGMVMFRNRLTGPSSRDQYQTIVDSKGGLHMNCPGSGSGLDPEVGGDDRKAKGYSVESHNVDSPPQAIALLHGLAALHDLARSQGV